MLLDKWKAFVLYFFYSTSSSFPSSLVSQYVHHSLLQLNKLWTNMVYTFKIIFMYIFLILNNLKKKLSISLSLCVSVRVHQVNISSPLLSTLTSGSYLGPAAPWSGHGAALLLNTSVICQPCHPSVQPPSPPCCCYLLSCIWRAQLTPPP